MCKGGGEEDVGGEEEGGKRKGKGRGRGRGGRGDGWVLRGEREEGAEMGDVGLGAWFGD